MSMEQGYHKPVLLNEVLENLVTDKNGRYCDCTLGGGGHLRAIAALTGPDAVLIGIDRDADAIEWNRNNTYTTSSKVVFAQNVFSNFDLVLKENGIDGVDGILLDLGVSSFQIENVQRGFSYMKENELDMRMNKNDPHSAADWIENASIEELSAVLEKYGEIRNATRMAAAIKNYSSPLKSSTDLKNCLAKEYGHGLQPDILARIFQAIRIAVNDELNELKKFLSKVYGALRPNGRLAIISYHSLEDRIVKDFIREAESSCICPKEQPVCTCRKDIMFKRITKKAIRPVDVEIKTNPRSRSARLRVAQKVRG
ncbi:MAG TPA: 16S rRNA (cytosine(1402)-N(4))-methyltransferase RsmH [Chitinispirillaceae bacterium]|nr:16S rRNA (cytosine(1402)-N(4))-methyltransferase RsmH [Chitinispirillaceae bacterium]